MKTNKKRNFKLYILMLITVLFVGCTYEKSSNETPKVIKGFVDLSSWDFEENGIIKLDGEWKFYWNELLTPGDFKNSKVECRNYFDLPSSLKGQVFDGKEMSDFGYGTLRAKVKLNNKNLVYGLKTRNILTSANIWINGELTASVGKVGKSEKEYSPIFMPTMSFFKSESDDIDIVIQTANFRELSSTVNSIWFGTKDQIIRKASLLLGLDLFLVGSIFIMALYHFALYIMRKENTSTLYFGLFCLVIANRQLFVGQRFLIQMFPNMSYEVLSKNAAITFYLAVPFFVMYLKEIFPELCDKIVKFTLFIGFGLTILCLFTINKVYDSFAVPFQIYVISICLYVIYILLKAVLNKKEGSKSVLLGFSAIFIAAICDICDYRGVIQTFFMMPVGLFIFTFSQSYLIAKRFSKAFYDVENLADENKDMYHKIKELNKDLEKKVSDRTKKLRKSSEALKNLLDNAREGFLSFGENLIIGEECSHKCYEIFKQNIENKRFFDIIYPDNEEEGELLKNILLDVLNEKDEYRKELLIGLLPNEIDVGGRNISVDYKAIKDINNPSKDNIMVVLTDISDKRYLENQIENERNILKMVVKVVVNYDYFMDCIRDYRYFCNKGIYSILNCGMSEDNKYYEILRNIHTFKGNFAQLDMSNVVCKLHKLEDEFSNSNNNLHKDNIEHIIQIMVNKNIVKWVDYDLSKLKEILGEEYFNQQNKPKYVSIKRLLKNYTEYTLKLSERKNKLVFPFEIEGDDFNIDREKYHGFIKSLVHVFRNMIDHGIEPVEERIASGKVEYGTIRCIVTLIDNNMNINIYNDGREIDIEEIKQNAVQKGILSKQEAKNLGKDKIIEIIFKDGFTICKNITDISGRGVGLSAVKQEVDKLDGKIKVVSESKTGTSFEFVIPLT